LVQKTDLSKKNEAYFNHFFIPISFYRQEETKYHKIL